MSTWPSDGRYRFDPASSLARVFTFKVDGLASALAHDLELHTRAFDGHVQVDGDTATVELRIDLWTLEVEQPLSGLQKREAEKTMQKKVLKDRKKAFAVLEGQVTRTEGDTHPFQGTLSLAGNRARALRADVALSAADDERIAARTERIRLVQTEHGITPYKAMMGMLKLQDRLDIEIDATLKKE